MDKPSKQPKGTDFPEWLKEMARASSRKRDEATIAILTERLEREK